MKSTLLLSFVLLFSAFNFAQKPYTIEQYLNIKSSSSPTLSPDGRQLAYLTNVTGTTQVWTFDLVLNKSTRLTNYDDNIGFVRWLGDGSGIIFGKAKGGDENTQFYWMDKYGGNVKALTNDPSVRHNFGLVTPNGETIYYASNKRNRTYFDIYSMSLDSGVETLLYQHDGNNDIEAVNNDGSKFIVSRAGTEFSLDNNLYLVDAKTKSEILLTPHKGPSLFGSVDFLPDGKSLVLASDNGREYYTLANMRLKNAANSSDWSDKNREMRYIDGVSNDVTGIAMSDSPSKIAFATNREGYSELWLQGIETGGKPLVTFFTGKMEQIPLPAQGVLSGLTVDRAQTTLAFSFSSATSSGEIWTYDLEKKKLRQVTRNDYAGVSQQTFVEPKLIKYKSFDGLEIPAWYYEPSRRRDFTLTVGPKGSDKLGVTKEKVPVIVSVHGGPEGQSRPGFNPLFQYYVSRGYAVLDLNVRGSTGYGKTYTHLDDVEKREDSVKDLAYSVEWLKTAGGADPKRIAVIGGSYGGYMTMAAITLYPDLWAAAVGTVAITNWETFLTNTSGYRRRQREVEYGRLDKDIEFLRRISPIRKIDRIKTPLFVISGLNDPRVPYTEGEQMVNALKKRGAVVEYKLYNDEGHGISKLKNRLELYPLVADFLDKYMRK